VHLELPSALPNVKRPARPFRGPTDLRLLAIRTTYPRAISTDSHIRELQSRAVIDAVAEETDDVPIRMKGPHDPLLLSWRQLCEDRRTVSDVRELGVAHLGHPAAEQDLARVQSYLMADLARDHLVVAGEDL
jgi:hypothetical protein